MGERIDTTGKLWISWTCRGRLNQPVGVPTCQKAGPRRFLTEQGTSLGDYSFECLLKYSSHNWRVMSDMLRPSMAECALMRRYRLASTSAFRRFFGSLWLRTSSSSWVLIDWLGRFALSDMASPLSQECFQLVGDGVDLRRHVGRVRIKSCQSLGSGARVNLPLRRAGGEDRQAVFGNRGHYLVAKDRVFDGAGNQESRLRVAVRHLLAGANQVNQVSGRPDVVRRGLHRDQHG